MVAGNTFSFTKQRLMIHNSILCFLETLDLWTTEERLSLISKMQEKIQPNDKFSYRRRLASAKWKWDEVAFGNKSAKECEDQFNELIHHITKVKYVVVLYLYSVAVSWKSWDQMFL